jgi:hypothetical protein
MSERDSPVCPDMEDINRGTGLGCRVCKRFEVRIHHKDEAVRELSCCHCGTLMFMFSEKARAAVIMSNSRSCLMCVTLDRFEAEEDALEECVLTAYHIGAIGGDIALCAQHKQMSDFFSDVVYTLQYETDEKPIVKITAPVFITGVRFPRKKPGGIDRAFVDMSDDADDHELHVSIETKDARALQEELEKNEHNEEHTEVARAQITITYPTEDPAHATIAYDPDGPVLRPHTIKGWWQVWSGCLCIALVRPEDMRAALEQPKIDAQRVHKLTELLADARSLLGCFDDLECHTHNQAATQDEVRETIEKIDAFLKTKP